MRSSPSTNSPPREPLGTAVRPGEFVIETALELRDATASAYDRYVSPTQARPRKRWKSSLAYSELIEAADFQMQIAVDQAV